SIAETMGLMNKAMGVLSGVAAAGKSVASDVVDAASRNVARVTAERPTAVPGQAPQSPPTDPSGGTTT
ncbi:MAG TPA: hypothetical protein VIB98_04170, partial [Gemmatimonadaceae bacterium]